MQRDDAIAAGVIALIFLEHLLFGITQDFLVLLTACLHIAFALAMLASRRFRQRLSTIPLHTIAWPFVVLLAVGLAGSLPLGGSIGSGYWELVPGAPAAISIDPSLSRLGVVQLAGYGALFLVGLMLAADHRGARKLVQLLMIAGLVFSVWAFIDHLADPQLVFGTERIHHSNRLAAAFYSANTAATLFGVLAVTAVAQLLKVDVMGARRRPAWMKHVVPALLLLFSSTCLVLTASRGGFAATLVGAFFAITGSIIIRRRTETPVPARAHLIALATLLGALTILAISGEHLLLRSEVIAADSSREQFLAIYWGKVAEAPWLGHGIGSLWSITSTAISSINADLLYDVRSAHNFIVQWTLQVGIVGAGALIFALGTTIWRMVYGFHVRRRGKVDILSVLAASIVFLVHGMADYSLEVPSAAAQFALLLGIGYAAATPTANRRR